MVLVSQVTEILNRLSPPYLKLEYDKIGLQVGSKKSTAEKVLVALEVTSEVVKEAHDKGAQLIVSHHPLIFQSLDRVLTDDYVGNLVSSLIKLDISLLVAHTNLDRASGGVNDVLADMLGLQDVEVLVPARDIRMLKLAVFVPEESISEVITAIGNAGGGVIGNYSHCTFRTRGTGTFYPMAGARPYLGKTGELNRVEEYRLEALVAPDKLNDVIKAMLDVHPYEEVAYDIYEVENPPAGVGLGRVGSLAESCKLGDCVELWSDKLDSKLKVSGNLEMIINRVAVCGGSGGDLIHAAKAAGADVYVTGDVKYHAAHSANAIGLAVIDAGHAETERLVVPSLAARLEQILKESGFEVDVFASKIDTNPWNKAI